MKGSFIMNEKLTNKTEEMNDNDVINKLSRLDDAERVRKEREAGDIQQLIADGVLERDFQGRLKKATRIEWVEDTVCITPPPHTYQISSEHVVKTIAKCDGHKYEVTLPGAVWSMSAIIEFTEMTNRHLSKESRDSHWYVESRNIYCISVGDAIDIVRGRGSSSSGVPKEVKDLLRIILHRNMKRISF